MKKPNPSICITLSFYFLIYYLVLPNIPNSYKNLLNIFLLISIFIFNFKLNINLLNNFKKLFKFKYYIYFYYFIFFIYLLQLQYFHLNTFFLTDNDVVSITEVILETSKGNFFLGHHFGDADKSNYLAHHFSPILLIFIPFFKILPFRITYCITILFFNLFGLFLWERVSFHLIKKKILYLFISILPLLNGFIFNLFTSYHFESLVFFFFLVFYYGLITKKFTIELIGYVSCILIKEDIPIYFSLISFFFLFKKDAKRFIFYLLVSSFYYSLITYYIQPSLDQSARVNWLLAWENWGKTKGEIIFNLLSSPKIVALTFFEKRKFFFNLFSSFGLLPLLSLSALPSLLALYTLQILSDRIWYNAFYHYYCYTILPFLILGTFDILQNWKRKKLFPMLILSFGLVLYNNKGNQDFPLKIGNINRERVENLKNVIPAIPKNSSVNTSFDLGMHLPLYLKIYPLKKDYLQEFILIDIGGTSPYYTIENMKEDIDKYLAEKKIILFSSSGTVKLYKRVY